MDAKDGFILMKQSCPNNDRNACVDALISFLTSGRKNSITFEHEGETARYTLNTRIHVRKRPFKRYTRLELWVPLSENDTPDPRKTVRPTHVMGQSLATILVVEDEESDAVVTEFGVSRQIELVIVRVKDIFSCIEAEKKSEPKIIDVCVTAQWVSGKHSHEDGTICFPPLFIISPLDSKLRDVAFRINAQRERTIDLYFVRPDCKWERLRVNTKRWEQRRNKLMKYISLK